MNSCSPREREDEGHLHELADSFPAHLRGIEPHSIQCFADGGFEKNMVGADKADARRLDAASFADNEESDDLAFDPGSSQTAGIPRGAAAVSECYLAFNPIGRKRCGFAFRRGIRLHTRSSFPAADRYDIGRWLAWRQIDRWKLDVDAVDRDRTHGRR